MELEKLVGQKLGIGIPGTKITPEIVAHFKELNAGGLILYRINFESPRQLKKLISDLENALQRKLLVMADHEGGRVVMFREGITVFPDSLALGKTHNEKYARLQGEIEAKELRRLGMDVNLSPVLDVLTESYSPNIGIRSYGEDWSRVSQMGVARIVAMQKNGVSACAKHFPGKGHAPVDAHLGLPTITSTWKEMEEFHLKPFLKAIEAGIHLVMSSHPFYPNLDPRPNCIATFSRKIIHDYLREKLNFQGVICSDDLEMGAIKELCSVGEAAEKASEAGHDLLLICHDLNAQKEAYHRLVDAYKNKRLPLDELEKSFDRIEALKAKRTKRFEGGRPQPEPRGSSLVTKICNESVTALNARSAGKPESLKKFKEKKLSVIFPEFSFFDEKIMVEKEVLKEEKFVLKEFQRFGLKPKVRIVSIEPNSEEIRQAGTLAEDSDLTLLFVFDAHLYPSNKALLDHLQSAAKKLVVALLRDPYDVEFVRKGIPCVTDYGWRACQIKSIIRLLCS